MIGGYRPGTSSFDSLIARGSETRNPPEHRCGHSAQTSARCSSLLAPGTATGKIRSVRKSGSPAKRKRWRNVVSGRMARSDHTRRSYGVGQSLAAELHPEAMRTRFGSRRTGSPKRIPDRAGYGFFHRAKCASGAGALA